MDFTDDQLQRYARHIVLPEVGGVGQEKLLGARVLVVGAGGLGAPLLLYLAAAGIGTLGVVDDDVVDLSNLQRQVIHATSRIGMSKVESAALTVADINPDVRLVSHAERLTPENVMRLIADYDIIADGSDNFDTRFLVNDACHLAGKTLVSGAILRFEGQIATFKSHLGNAYPCYRCLYRDPPPPGMIPSCSEGGVLGALAGSVGSLQATEVLKEVMDIGQSLAGQLILYDALDATFRKIKLPRDAACPLCGDQPSITDLSAHSAPSAP
ncbi:MAG: molybdopterin-synthase adenylyltransferase MoeB [Rhodospirillaceae bacterium]|nr:molybdopterin-synthase adenylyltransferase MoeB [Rhodospirillaceae bacterium]MBT5456250.1 molybdopterin-synthase adenylyltransferase MoeB [Rhodospirillaceae bacterium]